MHQFMKLGFGLFALLVSASQTYADESNIDLEDIWKSDWENRANTIIDGLVARLQEPLQESLDPRSLESVAKEYREVFESAINWEAFSDTVTKAITTSCNAEVLQEIAPYIGEPGKLSEAGEDLIQNFSSCYLDAMMHAEATAVYALAAKARDAGDVFTKYKDIARTYQRISPLVTTASVEANYGSLLDEVISIHDVAGLDARNVRTGDVTSLLESENAVLSVSLEDPGFTHTVFNQTFSYQRNGIHTSGYSCYGASPPEQEGLIHCSGNDEARAEDDMIKYTRKFDFNGESLEVIVMFDYDQLLNALQD